MEEEKITVHRVFKAPIEKIFTAFTNAEELKKWHSPEGMIIPEAESVLQVGGEYFMTMQDESNAEKYTVRGVYKEVDVPNKIVFTWKWDWDVGGQDTIVTVVFKKLSETETQVNLTHTGFEGKSSRDEREKGWISTFNKLEQMLEN